MSSAPTRQSPRRSGRKRRRTGEEEQKGDSSTEAGHQIALSALPAAPAPSSTDNPTESRVSAAVSSSQPPSSSRPSPGVRSSSASSSSSSTAVVVDLTSQDDDDDFAVVSLNTGNHPPIRASSLLYAAVLGPAAASSSSSSAVVAAAAAAAAAAGGGGGGGGGSGSAGAGTAIGSEDAGPAVINLTAVEPDDNVAPPPSNPPRVLSPMEEIALENKKAMRKITRQLTCAICQHHLTEPASTKCGHLFDLECVIQAIKVDHKCPTCRRRITNVKEVHRIYF